jgi:hypothetical protein
MRESGYLEHLSVDGTILKLIIEKWDERGCNGFVQG